MITSWSNLPKCLRENKLACCFHSAEEQKLWVEWYIEFGRQRLSDSKRWTTKSIRRNLNLLTPYEQMLLADIMNLTIWQYRSDRAKKKGIAGAIQAKSSLGDKQRLLSIFFEGKVKAEAKRTIEDALNERT